MLLFIDEFVFLEPCKRSYLLAEYSLKFLQHVLLILYQAFLSVAGTSRPPAIAWPSCLFLAFSCKCISPSMMDYQYQHWSTTSPLRSSLHCAMYVGRHTNCLRGGKKSSVVFAWEPGRVSMPLLGRVGREGENKQGSRGYSTSLILANHSKVVLSQQFLLNFNLNWQLLVITQSSLPQE